MNTLSDLFDDFLCVGLKQRLILLLADVVEEITGIHQFRDDIVGLIILEGLNELLNVRAALLCYLLHDVKLLKLLAIVTKSSLDLGLIDDLDCNFDLRVLVLGQDDKTERALSKASDRLIGVNAILIVALGFQDLIMPVVECLFAVEVDKPLHIIIADDLKEELFACFSVLLRIIILNISHLLDELHSGKLVAQL